MFDFRKDKQNDWIQGAEYPPEYVPSMAAVPLTAGPDGRLRKYPCIKPEDRITGDKITEYRITEYRIK